MSGENMAEREVDRRGFIKGSVVTSAGVALGLASFEEKNLLAQMSEGSKTKENKAGAGSGKMQYGQIKNLKISRVFCGGNLIGGWAHSRDLTYVSSLVKAYHTDDKILETFEIARGDGHQYGPDESRLRPGDQPVLERAGRQDSMVLRLCLGQGHQRGHQAVCR